MNRSEEHKKLLKKILLALSATGVCRVWRQETGAAYRGQKLIRYGRVGSADISGIMQNGKRLEVEVKTGKAVQNDAQKDFGKMINAMGGLYVVAKDVETVLNIVKTEAQKQNMGKCMKEAREFLRRHDFNPPDFAPDGKIHRFKRGGSSKSAWCVSWQNARTKDGSFYYVVVCGDYRTGEQLVYKPDKMTRADKKVIDQQIADKQKQIEKVKLAAQIETADLAQSRFARATKNGHTPYMDRKGIPDLYGCCVYEDRLQVPMRDCDGVLWSLQTIFANGDKRFMKGGRKKGLFHRLGGPIEDIAYLCEGFATAASIHQATRKPTVCAFDAGNLVEVAKELAKAFPDAELRICGDDDRQNEKNPGREKAEKAALLTSGIALFPEFEEGSGGTDFNDLHLSQGLDAVVRQLVGQPVNRTSGFIPLGYLDNTFFFYNIPTRDICKATTFAPSQLYTIATKSYWDAAYASENGKTRVSDAISDLIQSCQAAGPFCPENVRGTGVWRDNSRVVINVGSYLIVNGQRMGHTALKSRYIYIRDHHGLGGISAEHTTDTEGQSLINICQLFKWAQPRSAHLLAGWIAISRIAGALNTRPHIWLTGPRGCGKSEIFRGLLDGALGARGAKLHVEGSTTEAGLRQALRASSIPILFDEFEINATNLLNREAVLELLRSAWSEGEGIILKGSAGSQTAMRFTTNSPALLSSIRVVLQNDADQSRFSVLELLPHGDNMTKANELHTALAAIDQDFGERLFTRMTSLIPAVEKSTAVFLNLLAKSHGFRYGRQIGTLLAGAHHLHSCEVISTRDASEVLAEFFSNEDEDEVSAVEMADEEEALHHLLTWRLDLSRETELGSTRLSMSVADALRSSAWHKCLVAYGIKVMGDSQFAIANRHAELAKIYRGTHWAGNWAGPLKRAGGKTIVNTTFGSRQNRGRGVAFELSIL